jgi:hypothetical protein
MTQKENILQELNELKSTLASVTPQNVYTVPVGYFDELPAQILNRIKAMEAKNAVDELGYLSPSLSNISRQMPYAVPAGYFEGLAENVIQLVSESNNYQTPKEELETLSPLLSGLKKTMSARTGHSDGPYSVPQGYFESLGEKINKPAAKVVSITHRRWFRYAAAAVITGAIIVGGFLFSGKGGGEKEPGGKALAKLTLDVKKMDDTQKDSLMDFIDAGMDGKETVQVNTDNKSNDVKDLINGISDEELKDFQEQTEDIQGVLMTN